MVSKRSVPRLSCRELVSEFLEATRKSNGQKTARTYRSRLRPVLDFAERRDHLKRWPFAESIDSAFAVELRAYLHQYATTRNGRPNGAEKPLSSRQIRNILECLRAMCAWAKRVEVRKLSADWINPITADLVGPRPEKDPLREDRIPLEKRVELIGVMDQWQLCHLTMSVLLPLRPEEAAGILISEVDFEKSWINIGTRFEGADFTKKITSFKMPFPPELRPILVACIGARSEGPLLRSRQAFSSGSEIAVASKNELADLLNDRLCDAPPGSICCAQDRKEIFRRLLHDLGGVETDQFTTEFKKLMKLTQLTGVSFYFLRSSVTTAMKNARMPLLELRII